ncbi:MAG: hypothetical protein ACOCXH_01965 [Cyclobacteriaceae bacterium]
MKKFFVALFFAISFLCALPVTSIAQEVGLSFSYFIPRNGHFAVPVSPFSYREVGINFNDYLSLETGFSVYLMPGLGVTDLPFEAEEPLMGPLVSLMVPLELVLQFYLPNQVIRIKAGGFGFYNIFSQIREGNLDRAIADWQNLDVVTSNFDYDNLPGFGLMGGLKYIVYLQKNFGITLGVNYLLGNAPLNLNGSYLGGVTGGSVQNFTDVEFEESKLDFTGFEFSIGVLVGGGS